MAVTSHENANENAHPAGWNPGRLESCNIKPYNLGTVEKYATLCNLGIVKPGTVEPFNPKTPDCQNFGTLQLCNPGTWDILGPCKLGTLTPWNLSTL